MKKLFTLLDRFKEPVYKLLITCVSTLAYFESSAQFVGDYAIENWTFSCSTLANEVADGYLELDDLPKSITIVGNDDGLSSANADLEITIDQSTILKFNWSYDTNDGPHYDRAGFKINGVFFSLTDPDGSDTQSGDTTLNLNAGDVFAFTVDATDACCGRGSLTIETFGTGENNTPMIDQPANIITSVNSGLIEIPLSGILAGADESDQSVTITATSNNVTLIDPVVNYTSPNQTGTISFTPATDSYGDATITIKVSDDGGTSNGSIDFIETSFSVSVTSNFPPNIDNINSNTIQINQELDIQLSGIDAGGEDQEISIIAESLNPSIISDEGIEVDYTSSNTTGTLTINPIPNAVGTATIRITVSDDGGNENNGKNETIIYAEVKVLPNGQPSIDDLEDIFAFINSGNITVDVSGIDDGDTDVTQELSISVTSSNTDLIPSPVANYVSPETTGFFILEPVTDLSGTSTITVTVADNAGTSGSGLNQKSISFDVTISGNFQPQIAELNNINLGINETARVINLTNITPGIISGEEELTVTAASSNVNLISNEGISVDYTSPETTGSITISTLENVIGESKITVTVKDNAGTNFGGIDTKEESFVIKVKPNNRPNINQVSDIYLGISAGEQSINLSGITSGESSNYQNLLITASSDNTSLTGDPEIEYTSPYNTGILTFTPLEDQSGTANITVKVADNGGTLYGGIDTVSMSFLVSIASNHQPTMNAIENVYMSMDDEYYIDLTGISDGGTNNQNIGITATSSDTLVVKELSLDYDSGNSEGELSIEPAGYGKTTITVTVRDDGGTENGGIDSLVQTFDVYVIGNTPPNMSIWEEEEPIDGATFTLSNRDAEYVILFGVDDSEDHNITSITATGDNPTLENVLSISYTPGNFIGGLKMKTTEGQNGTINYTLTLKDDGGTENNGIDSTTISFTVLVLQPTTYEAKITSNTFDQPEYGTPPSFTEDEFYFHKKPFTISKSTTVLVENWDGNENEEDVYLSIYEDEFDYQNPLQNVLSVSSNPALELSANTQYFIVTGTETANQSLQNAISVLEGSVNFGYIPNINIISNSQTDEDTKVTVNLDGISDGDSNTDNLTLEAFSSTSGAFSSFDFSDNKDGSAILAITPAKDVNGNFTVTVQVANEDGNTYSRDFNLKINAINDAPLFTLDKSELNISRENLEEPFTIAANLVNVPADETSQQILFSISPDASDFVDISIDNTARSFTFSNFKEVKEDLLFNITANDQQPVNSTATQNLTLSLNTILGTDGINHKVLVYPNPGPGVFYIALDENFGSLQRNQINILNISGNQVSSVIDIKDNKAIISIETLPDGVYILQIEKANGVKYTSRIHKLSNQ